MKRPMRARGRILEMKQPQHVPYNRERSSNYHITERSLRAHGYEMSSQLYQYSGPSTRGDGSFGRKSVTVKIVSAVQEHEKT